MLLRIVVWILSTEIIALGAGVVFGQTTSTSSGQAYPHKPIRIVTAEVGGGQDFVARLIAQGLTNSLGQQMIVDNRAAGVIPGEIVTKASPDGYTLLVSGSNMWIAPFIQNVPYDPVRDFSPIISVATSPSILVVNPSVPANSVNELIALAKARPGALNYGSGPTGGANHLAAELCKAMAGINIVRIPYKGNGPALNDLIGGQVQLMFSTAASVAPHLRSGRLRALAVTSRLPSALLPGVPTVASSGLPGYEAVVIYGGFAPAKTPATLINRLNREIVQFLNQPDVKQKFLNSGVETIGSTPEQFAATIKSDMVKWGRVIKDASIRAD